MGKRTTKYPKYIRRAKGTRASHCFKFRIKNALIDIPEKRFNFKIYGGEQNALKEAINYRDKILKKYKLDYLIKIPNTINIRTINGNTNSGVIGIFLNKITNSENDYNWCLKYSDGGKLLNRSYSCNYYGYEFSFLLACKHRAKVKNYLVIVDKNKMPVSISELIKFLSNTIPKENIIINKGK